MLLTLATLTACGGGGSGANPFVAGGTATAATPGTTQTITGTAAVGAALGGAIITAKDSSNPSKTVTTIANATTGVFTLNVTGFTAPVILQAAHTSVGVNYLYSILPTLNITTTNVSNVNLTPITTLVMYELNNGVDPGNLYRAGSFGAITNVQVNNAETTVRTNLAKSLTAAQTTAFNAVPVGFSMMYGTLVIGDVYDKTLDAIGKVTAYLSNGSVTLTTIAGVVTTYTRSVVVGTVAPVAAKITMLLSSSQLPSSGTAPVTLTAVVLDAAGQTMVGRAVTFSVPATETAFISNISGNGISDTNGSVTAKLNLGINKANRTITVTAIVDAVSTTSLIDVTGTTVSISGGSSIALNASANMVFTVKDSAGVALPNIPVTIASKTGNTIAPVLTNITNATGVVTALVTATKAGNDIITATAAGASGTTPLVVSADSFAFQNPSATPPEIPLNTVSAVSVAWTNASGVVAAAPVNFYSTRGVIGASAVTAAGTGVASTNVSSASAGPAMITATGTGGTPSATMQVIFVATTATSVIAQASPGIVQVTTGSPAQTSNSSVISVVVRDALNNLVKNATVNFSIAADPTAGVLSSPNATTDINGSASVSYTAGATSSPQNGVSIVATVVAVGVTPTNVASKPVLLTVSGQNLFVRLGTDNLLGQAPPVAYQKTYVALVTDAAGNPMVNVPVRFVFRPTQYFKGQYTPSLTAWVPVVSATCPNEDVNFNGIIDNIDPLTKAIVPVGTPGSVSEDTNANGALEPGGVAGVTASATTDANGMATVFITYPKNYANWSVGVLEARAGVLGSEPPTTAIYRLEVLSTDVTNLLVSPPGVFSPFGQSTLCTNTL